MEGDTCETDRWTDKLDRHWEAHSERETEKERKWEREEKERSEKTQKRDTEAQREIGRERQRQRKDRETDRKLGLGGWGSRCLCPSPARVRLGPPGGLCRAMANGMIAWWGGSQRVTNEPPESLAQVMDGPGRRAEGRARDGGSSPPR